MLHGQLDESVFARRHKNLHNFQNKLSNELAGIVGSKLIKKLILRNCSLKSDDLAILSIVVRSLPSLQVLDLAHNEIDRFAIPELMTLLRFSQLETLNLNNNNLRHGEIEDFLARAKALNRKLSLGLDSQALSRTQYQALKRMTVSTLVSLQEEAKGIEMIIPDRDFSGDKLKGLLIDLDTKAVSHLVLKNCKIGNSEFQALSNTLCNTQAFSLERLDLSNNEITEQVCPEITKLMLGCETLVAVDLTHTPLGQVCFFEQTLPYFAKLILDAPVDLSSNMEMNAAIAAGPPGEVKMANARDKKLNLSDKNLSDEDLSLELSELSESDILEIEEIMCERNRITDTGLKTLLSLAIRCPQLRVLNCSSNQIALQADVIRMPMQALSQLEHLNLSQNKIDDEGVCALAEEITHALDALKLQQLVLNHNTIGSDGARALRQIEGALPTLKLSLDPLNLVDEVKPIPKSENIDKEGSKSHSPAFFGSPGTYFADIRLIDDYYTVDSPYLRQ